MNTNQGRPKKGQELPHKTRKAQKKDGQLKKARTVKLETKDWDNLSAYIKEHQEIIQSIKKIPDMRIEKIGRLKKVIISGAYTIDPVKIAERMLEEI